METLLHTAAKTEAHIYILFEGGTFEPETFEPFQQQHARSLYSLYQHPQLLEAKWVGPWLYQVKNNADLATEMAQFPQVVTVIFSSLELKPLAMQLAWGCTVVKPDLETIVSRFYIHAVVSVLAGCQQEDWHYYLFSGTSAWWHNTLAGWQSTEIHTKPSPIAYDRTVYLDAPTWALIDDPAEVKSVLAEWQAMPMSQHFPPCIQRQKVIQALQKANDAGLQEKEDRRLYALFYLNGKRSVLTSEFVLSQLARVIQGECSLERVLSGYAKHLNRS